MIYDNVFWDLVGSIIVLAVWLGWLRSRSIRRAYRSICADLKNAGISLSNEEMELLMGQLVWNPRAAVQSDGQPESRAIKERHIGKLVRSRAVIWSCFWTFLAAGAGLLFWLQLMLPGAE